MPDDLSQLPAPGIGEVYRLLVRLEQRINELSAELRSKVVTLDVYQVAHNNMQEKLAATEKDLEHHLGEHAEASKTKDYHQKLMAAAGITAAVSFFVGIAGIIVAVVH